MKSFGASELKFNYHWNECSEIPVNDTDFPFNPENGHHVLHVINQLFSKYNFWNDQKALLLMEKRISQIKDSEFTCAEILQLLIKMMDDL